jgi:hypothetical protein
MEAADSRDLEASSCLETAAAAAVAPLFPRRRRQSRSSGALAHLTKHTAKREQLMTVTAHID